MSKNISLTRDDHGESDTVTVDKVFLKTPKKYKVLLHNDDYTTMEFVIFVLEAVFNKNPHEAHQIMMQVHEQGVGVCGVYSLEIAETKTQKVLDLAKEEEHPLVCTFEAE